MTRLHLYVCISLLLAASCCANAVTKEAIDSLVSDIKSSDPNICSRAAIKLAEYGPEASDAFTALLTIISGKEHNLYASSVLPYVAVGQPIEQILTLTKNENTIVQSLALECLKQYDLDKEQTLKVYTALLDHENPFVRLAAVDALCQAGAGELCLDTVIQLTNHEDPLIKAMAVSALEDIGIANKQVKQVLLDAFSNTDKREVVKAALIYQKLFPTEKEGTAQIRKCLADKDRNVRWHAVRAVGNLKDVNDELMQTARALMHDEDKIVAIHACCAMIRHSVETERAWQPLMKSVESDNFDDLLVPLMVLKELGPEAQRCQKELFKMVNHEDSAVQLIVIHVLGEIGLSRDSLLPVLENKLKTTDDFFVWNITKKTMKKITSSADNKV